VEQWLSNTGRVYLKVLEEEPTSVSPCPLQIPLGQAWDWTRVVVQDRPPT